MRPSGKYCWRRTKCYVINILSFSNNFSYGVEEFDIIPFPNKPWFLRVCSKSLLKTLREKEKLLVMSNFSFSHSVSYPFQKCLLFSSNLKLSSAKSFSLQESKNCRLGKGYAVHFKVCQKFSILKGVETVVEQG